MPRIYCTEQVHAEAFGHADFEEQQEEQEQEQQFEPAPHVSAAGDLGFTAVSEQYYDVSGNGTVLCSLKNPTYRPALCHSTVMSSGRNCAEFTLLRKPGEVMVGVGRPTLDVNEARAQQTADFWGVYSGRGDVHHAGTVVQPLQGNIRSQPFSEGDVLRLLLDSEAGSLTLKMNGILLGVVVASGLTGDLCWTVSCFGTYNEMRIQLVDPSNF